MTDANRIDGIAHHHGNFAAPSAGVAAAGSLIDEALALSRQVRPYPSEATLANMAACIPEGTPTRAVLDAWLHARRQGDERPTIHVGATVWDRMHPTARQTLAGLVDLRQSGAIGPDEVVWVKPVPMPPLFARPVAGFEEIP